MTIVVFSWLSLTRKTWVNHPWWKDSFNFDKILGWMKGIWILCYKLGCQGLLGFCCEAATSSYHDPTVKKKKKKLKKLYLPMKVPDLTSTHLLFFLCSQLSKEALDLISQILTCLFLCNQIELYQSCQSSLSCDMDSNLKFEANIAGQ